MGENHAYSFRYDRQLGGARLLGLIRPRPEKRNFLPRDYACIVGKNHNFEKIYQDWSYSKPRLSIVGGGLCSVQCPRRWSDRSGRDRRPWPICRATRRAAAITAPPQPKVKYVPVYVQAPPRSPRQCWYEKREEYDDEGDLVRSKVKVCR